VANYPHVPAEPPLACYVTASCPPAPFQAAAGATAGATTRKCKKGKQVKHGKCLRKRNKKK
jgi:hypothetical protein